MGDNDDNPFVVRNPLIILDPDPVAVRVCPICKGTEISGRSIQGMVYFTCLVETCKNKWQGGLPRVPEDPRVPKPPINPKDKPRVTFDYDPRTRDSVEIDYPVDLTQDFRKGALISEDDDYE